MSDHAILGRGAASLAACRSQAARRNGPRTERGRLNERPREKFIDDLKLVIGVDLVRGQDAVLAATSKTVTGTMRSRERWKAWD
ncbi:hypothetical protein ASG50_16550 [Rhizobium sp. Leaf386]|nr:hypothetical protein ASG50_16550 [Rhizobium sp. Leaf386]